MVISLADIPESAPSFTKRALYNRMQETKQIDESSLSFINL